jgi:hypothetical protein
MFNAYSGHRAFHGSRSIHEYVDGLFCSSVRSHGSVFWWYVSFFNGFHNVGTLVSLCKVCGQQ